MTHDAGGSKKWPLQPGVMGEAHFSECELYRHYLIRTWNDYQPAALFIGMNPSTASANIDDPTIRAEMDFCRRWGYGRLYMANVMDYRATNPAALLLPAVRPRSANNLLHIQALAAKADKIVVAHGALHKRLQRYGDETTQLLRLAGHQLFCLGLTKSGQPTHPLYIPRDREPIAF